MRFFFFSFYLAIVTDRPADFSSSFVSRATPKSSDRHVILGVIGYKPRDFASQMNLSLNNGWGIVRTIADMCLKMSDGKYVLVKDPNKPVLRLYEVPLNTFDEDADDETKPDNDDEDDEDDDDEDDDDEDESGEEEEATGGTDGAADTEKATKAATPADGTSDEKAAAGKTEGGGESAKGDAAAKTS